MTTLTTMVQRVSGLLGTKQISTWEEIFITSIVAKTKDGTDVSGLTELQVDKIEELFDEHFCG